jgi:hypothetical protein
MLFLEINLPFQIEYVPYMICLSGWQDFFGEQKVGPVILSGNKPAEN